MNKYRDPPLSAIAVWCRDVFLKRSGPVSPGSDIAAAHRNGERRLIPNGSDTLAERR
jgi:hypothetical protein